MKFTDVFIRRPVLAIVVNLVIIIAGIQAIRSLNVRQYPAARERHGHGPHRLRRRQRRPGARLHHHAARAGDRRRGRHRLHRVAEHTGAVDDQRPPASSTSTPSRRLADISARVNQVRADLPPEAEVPAINIEPSDAQFAAMYLSFGSDILEDNQVTDYLIRVVQPRLSAIEGVQRADILGGRTFAIRAWLKPDRMAALDVSPAAGAPGAGRQQLPRRGRADQGPARPDQPDRQHRPEVGRRVQEARRPRRATARSCASRTSPTSSSAPTTTTRRCASRAASAVVHGRLGAARTPTRSTSSTRVRQEIESIQKELPDGDEGERRLRLDRSTSTAPSTRSSTRCSRRSSS